MSLALEDLLPSEDSLLFKEPDPVAMNTESDLSNHDTYPSLDIPDFSNFTIEDVNFGDLEFLDLATAPLERTKRSNPTMAQYSDMYFNSLATPSGYCSANFLTEEANRLSCLFQDKEERGEGALEKGLLENLEELFGHQSSGAETDKNYSEPQTDEGTTAVYEVSAEVLSLMAKNFESLQVELENEEENCEERDFREITIKSVQTLETDSKPPPGAVAKIIIRSCKAANYTRFTFSSLDDKETHSFQINTGDVKKATQALRPLNMDSVRVIRKLLKLGPRKHGQGFRMKPRIEQREIQLVSNAEKSIEDEEDKEELEEDEGFESNREDKTDRDKDKMSITATCDTESSIKESLLCHGIKVESLVRLNVGSGQRFWCCPESDCTKAYMKGHEMKLHILGHYNVKPFQCQEPGCSWGFVTKNKLMRHMASHTKNRNFTCNVEGCDKKFSTIYNLNSHLKLHDRSFIFSCIACDGKFQTERELQVHISKEHKHEVAPPLSCPLPHCDKAYYTKSTLDAHIRSHATATTIKCDICFKQFDKPSRLKQHMIYHTGEKPYVCDFPSCSWRFPTSSKLTRHRRTHNQDRPHECSTCGKTFGRTEHLSLHMATHTVKGQLSKAYVCTVEECSKVFTTLPQQQAHLKSHKEKVEEGQDISAGQLDFVALLSSVGEEVITTQLGGETDGLLELVTVEEEGVETVVSVGDWPPPVEEQPEGRMMSAGLVTLDTTAISSQQGRGNKRRASGQLGDRETLPKMKCEESITNTIPVTVQYIIEHKDGVQESTINLQDLE